MQGVIRPDDPMTWNHDRHRIGSDRLPDGPCPSRSQTQLLGDGPVGRDAAKSKGSEVLVDLNLKGRQGTEVEGNLELSPIPFEVFAKLKKGALDQPRGGPIGELLPRTNQLGRLLQPRAKIQPPDTTVSRPEAKGPHRGVGKVSRVDRGNAQSRFSRQSRNPISG